MASGTWTPTSNMPEPRVLHTATLLGDGRVLVAGGLGDGGILASAEVYDAVANTWKPTGDLVQARARHTATLLGDGRVLVVGGPSTTLTEVYDPSAGTWASR